MARKDDAKTVDTAKIVDGMDDYRGFVTVGCDLHKGEVGPRRGLGNVVAPALDRVRERASRACVILLASENEAFEGIEAPLPVPKARAPSAVRGDHDVLDDGATQLRAIEGGQIDESEQVAEGVGSALALAPTVDYELALRTQRSCESLEGRLNSTDRVTSITPTQRRATAPAARGYLTRLPAKR